MIDQLHHITQGLNGQPHHEEARLACEGGVTWVQVRVKNQPLEQVEKIVRETMAITHPYGATVIVNDHLEVAYSVGAHGVHLGQGDTDPVEARKLLGPQAIIGGTANTFEDVERMTDAGVDYVGVGPFQFTSTKKNLSPTLGLAGYQTIVQQCQNAGIRIPVIAIGGIQPEDVIPIQNTGVYGIAVSSGINAATSPVAASQNYLANIKQYANTHHR